MRTQPDKNRTLSPTERNIRMNIRNFLLAATRDELEKEKRISEERGDLFRRDCIQELLDEDK